MTMERPLMSNRKCALYGAAYASATLAFDLYYPTGIAGAMPYIALPLFGLLARASRSIVSLAVLGTLLNIAGVFLSSSGAPLYVVVINHLMSGILVWLVAYIALTHMAVGDKLRASLHDAAFRDPLTRLYNRRYILDVFRSALKQYRRYADPFSVIMIDADHFKQINDQHGHCAGDVALQAIADVCSKSVRDTDVVGRFGGEEFIVLLPHTTAADATSVAERIRRTILREKCSWQGRPLDITLSLGVAEAGPLTATREKLIKAADQALYSAKNSGRNKTVTAEAAQRAGNDSLAEVRAA
jgi:diguanylate cyclase (GGDEF)-like protein